MGVATLIKHVGSTLYGCSNISWRLGIYVTSNCIYEIKIALISLINDIMFRVLDQIISTSLYPTSSQLVYIRICIWL